MTRTMTQAEAQSTYCRLLALAAGLHENNGGGLAVNDPITDHRFTVRRQDGIGPHPDDMPCSTCGRPKAAHTTPCTGVLTIKGESFHCDLTSPHTGWAHSSTAAQAIWK